MQIKKSYFYTIATFLLLYYCYFNNMRKILIPLSNITVPILLCISFGLIIVQGNFKIVMRNGAERGMCLSWILIACLISVNNASIFKNLISGGMIQLYVMVSFLIFASSYKSNWIRYWFDFTRTFAMVHTIATIIFYFSPMLFYRYVYFMFSGDTLSTVIRNYNRGYMTGLCGHFSTNGMILGIGILFWIEAYLYQRRVSTKVFCRAKLISIICVLATLYALILTSKRAPLIAAIIAIAVVYIVYQQKNVIKRLLILTIICIIVYGAYILLVNYIPGLSTIIDKFRALEDSDAGILNGRSGLWERAVTMFKANPLFGAGYGSYSDYASETNAITTSAHNYYLQIMAELGVVGLILYVIAFLSGGIYCFKKLAQAARLRDYKTVMYLSVAMEVQLFVLVYNMSATALMYYYILIPYFMACAVPRIVEFDGGNT